MLVIKTPNTPSADQVLNTLGIASEFSPLIFTAIIAGVTSMIPVPQKKKMGKES